jgi:ribonuclease HI
VLNQDLWRVLDGLQEKVTQQGAALQWRYVKGHSGDRGNDRCDEIARSFATGNSPSLQQSWQNGLVQADANPIALKNVAPKQVEFDPPVTNVGASETIQSSHKRSALAVEANLDMVDSTIPDGTDLQSEKSEVPREVKVAQLRNVVDTLHMADEIARQGYLITSSELADLMDVNASAVTSRGDNWVWRNWVISRVRREGNQILWQLERVD